LPIGQDDYAALVGDPRRFRAWLDRSFRRWPELFPKALPGGYRLKDARTSTRAGVRLRRIRLKATGASFSVRPPFLLPYMTGTATDAQGPLFLRAFGAPFWALARAFGRSAMHWYRLEVSPGRPGVAGTTVHRADLPEYLLADEHHQTREGTKSYSATTVGAGCCPGAALAPTANADDLTGAYAVFKREAQDIQPGYRPRTVSADGWAATSQAWRALVPLAALLRRFLHGWLVIRSRGKLDATFAALSGKVWEAYRAPGRRSFGQRLRRLREWARRHVAGSWVLAQVQKLCGQSQEYGLADAHPGGHRTSTMLDRVMRSVSRYFEGGQHLHGSPEACGRHVRAWALLQNFRPWGPEAARDNGGWRSPAEPLNGHRYHGDWLQNLQVSASLGGYRR
jgi:hypothetical protein